MSNTKTMKIKEPTRYYINNQEVSKEVYIKTEIEVGISPSCYQKEGEIRSREFSAKGIRGLVRSSRYGNAVD